MKKVIISTLLSFIAVYLSGQDFSMYLKGNKISYELSTKKMLIRSDKLDERSIKNALQNTVAGSLENIERIFDDVFLIEMQNASKENLQKLRQQWSYREDVIYITPVFVDERGIEGGGYTNEVIVRLKPKDDYSVLEKFVEIYSIKEIIKLGDFDEFTYILNIPNNAHKDAMHISNELYETGMFEYAHPNIITLWPYATTDTYFNKQWGLKNTGQVVPWITGGKAGIDINVEPAWSITTGSPNIKIAILDVGVHLTHPDLVNNLLQGYDATGNNSNGAVVDSTSGDFSHGTKCAGVAAAQANNNKGIAGVAFGSKILPINVSVRSSGFSSLQVAKGINWAWRNGADVISMSFNCGQTDMLAAIDSAISFGRNNKGCVLVAASHNHGQPNVAFPASSDKVIAVGAISNNGQRKPESNYGPLLDVVAPGEGIYTTGMLNTTQNSVINDGMNGVYHPDFSATSAATPHIAGIAALVLSVNNNLTAQEVRNIISMTAKKLEDYTFTTVPGYPNGTRNNEVGYGLADAHAAVQAAVCTNSLSGTTLTSNRFARCCNNQFTMQSVIVSNNSKLTVKANETSINAYFEVNAGSQFEIR
jgi:subtilisin family serine protease